MSIIKKFIFIVFITTFIGQVNSEEIKKMGTHKDWETYIINSDSGKVCFAQSKPILQAPKANPRDARLFIYEFNKKNSITAKSGKNKYKFDIAQEGFAWMADNKLENKMIKTMKKGSRIMVTGYNQKGSQTIDHYSLLGFTKAYNAAKANCS